MTPARRLVVLLFWLTLAGSYVAAIVPQPEAPHLGSTDKVDHMAAFLTLTLLGRLAYPHRSPLGLFLALAAFGGFIELSQALPLIHRDAEWADWFADMAATLLGLLLAWPLNRLVDRRLR